MKRINLKVITEGIHDVPARGTGGDGFAKISDINFTIKQRKNL